MAAKCSDEMSVLSHGATVIVGSKRTFKTPANIRIIQYTLPNKVLNSMEIVCIQQLYKEGKIEYSKKINVYYGLADGVIRKTTIVPRIIEPKTQITNLNLEFDGTVAPFSYPNENGTFDEIKLKLGTYSGMLDKLFLEHNTKMSFSDYLEKLSKTCTNNFVLHQFSCKIGEANLKKLSKIEDADIDDLATKMDALSVNKFKMVNLNDKVMMFSTDLNKIKNFVRDNLKKSIKSVSRKSRVTAPKPVPSKKSHVSQPSASEFDVSPERRTRKLTRKKSKKSPEPEKMDISPTSDSFSPPPKPDSKTTKAEVLARRDGSDGNERSEFPKMLMDIVPKKSSKKSMDVSSKPNSSKSKKMEIDEESAGPLPKFSLGPKRITRKSKKSVRGTRAISKWKLGSIVRNLAGFI